MSLVESGTSIAVGFGISLAAQIYFLPLLGVQVRLDQNFAFALIMTGISLARQFVMRRIFEALHIRRPLSPFMQAVIAERHRQIEIEGFSPGHDDEHRRGELASAAAAYLIGAGKCRLPPNWWPWSDDWWKPQGVRRDLVRGAALAIAEGERFDRSQRHRVRIRGARSNLHMGN